MDLTEIIQKLEKCDCLVQNEIEYIQDLIERDGLTNVKNRRAFDRDVEEEVQRAESIGYDITLLLVDVDDFKKYNDNNGHLKGDEVLKQIAQVLNSSTKTFDHTYRYGGEEFAILLPNTTVETGYAVAERIREKVSTETEATVTIGLSNYKITADSLYRFIQFADAALYVAKRNGKNQSIVYR